MVVVADPPEREYLATGDQEAVTQVEGQNQVVWVCQALISRICTERRIEV